MAPAVVQSLQAELDAARQRESELTSRIAALESRDKSTGGTELELQQQFESRLKVACTATASPHTCVLAGAIWPACHAGAALQPAAVSAARAGRALSAPLHAQLSPTVNLQGHLRHQ